MTTWEAPDLISIVPINCRLSEANECKRDPYDKGPPVRCLVSVNASQENGRLT